MADMSAQWHVTRFSLDLWMRFFCRSKGAPILMLQAHAVARTKCSCKICSLDPQGDHVYIWKKHTGAIRGHNHAWMSFRNWPATQATLCASATRCRRRRPQATSRVMSSLWTLVFMAITITSVIAQSTMDTSIARCTPMIISRHVLGSETGGTKMIVVLLVWRLHLHLCQWLAKFILSFSVSCGSWLTNRRAITMRSSAQRRTLYCRLFQILKCIWFSVEMHFPQTGANFGEISQMPKQIITWEYILIYFILEIFI